MRFPCAQVGVLGDVLSNAENVVAKGRLGPGQMVMVDMDSGSFKGNVQIAQEVAARQPYAEWAKADCSRLSDMNASTFLSECQLPAAEALKMQAAVGA